MKNGFISDDDQSQDDENDEIKNRRKRKLSRRKSSRIDSGEDEEPLEHKQSWSSTGNVSRRSTRLKSKRRESYRENESSCKNHDRSVETVRKTTEENVRNNVTHSRATKHQAGTTVTQHQPASSTTYATNTVTTSSTTTNTKSFNDVKTSLQTVVSNISHATQSPSYTSTAHNNLVGETRISLLKIIADLKYVEYSRVGQETSNDRLEGQPTSGINKCDIVENIKTNNSSIFPNDHLNEHFTEVLKREEDEPLDGQIKRRFSKRLKLRIAKEKEKIQDGTTTTTNNSRVPDQSKEEVNFSGDNPMKIPSSRETQTSEEHQVPRGHLMTNESSEDDVPKCTLRTRRAHRNAAVEVTPLQTLEKIIPHAPTPRSSERLKNKSSNCDDLKVKRRQYKEKLFEQIEDEASNCSSNLKYNTFKRTQTNNLVYCASRYNSERAGEYGEEFSESDDSFINDSEDLMSTVKMKKNKSWKSSSTKNKKRKVIATSDEDEKDDGDDNVDCVDDVKYNGDKNDEKYKPNTSDNGDNYKTGGDNPSFSSWICGDKESTDPKLPNRQSISTRNVRISRRKEKTTSQLERLQKLRALKKLPLKEKEKLLKNSSDSNSDLDDRRPPVLQEESSDREFIDDEQEVTEEEKEDEEEEDEEESPSTSKKDSFKRVLTADTSSEEENDSEVRKKTLTAVERTFFAALNNNITQSVKNILESAKTSDSLVNYIDENGDTALHNAVRNRNHEIVILLLESKANPDFENIITKSTPLTEAAMRKDPQCFETLLSVTNILEFSHRLKEHNGKNILHLLVTTHDVSSNDETEKKEEEENVKEQEGGVVDVAQCIAILKYRDRNKFKSYLLEQDQELDYPIMTAIKENCVEGVRSLMLEINECGKMSCFDHVTEEGGNLIHFAVLFSAECLDEILPYATNWINNKDSNGWTPLMYTAELGKKDCMKLLYEAGASIHVEVDGMSPLHMAAARCDLDSIRFLLECGHPVLITDNYGWPPLLYATFKGDKDCVVELFKKDPSQLFCLKSLLNGENNEKRDMNRKVIQKTLESISHIDAYYRLFNNFISANMQLLDDNNLGVFLTAWKRILSFKNKATWLRNKYRNATSFTRTPVKVDRSCVLKSAMNHLKATFSIYNLDVSFKGEAGSCLGPKREFLDCLVKDAIDPKNQLFTSSDNNKTFRPLPNFYFYQKMKGKVTKISADTKQQKLEESVTDESYDCEIIGGDLSAVNVNTRRDVSMSDAELLAVTNDIQEMEMEAYEDRVKEIKEGLRFLGRFAARVLLDNEVIQLQFTNSFLNKILGIPLKHPECLSKEDYGYYRNIQENDVSDLDMSFSAPCVNPWTGNSEEVSLSDDNDKMLTEDNKQEYLESLSSFLYETVIEEEMEQFRSGFYQCIYQKDIEMFTTDEFCLLLNGVSKIDVDDWQRNTLYSGWSKNCDVITWFWRLVKSLKEEEKALLLKFATGSPSVPIGGFANLKGLGYVNQRFTIHRYGNLMNDKLPGASTCFNLLKLPDYSSEDMLRDKVLIAIRHGSEGFEFS